MIYKSFILVILLFCFGCQKNGDLVIGVNFPSTSPKLTEKEKEELKEKIKIKNIELFIDSGDLEVIIK